MTTETVEVVQSDTAASSNDVDIGLSHSAAESNELIAVSYDSAAPASMSVDVDHHAVLPSLIHDGAEAELPEQPPGDGSPSAATATTASCSVQPEESSDWSTQWGGTDTVQTVNVSQPASTVFTEDDSPAAMKEQQNDNESFPAAQIIVEPSPSSHLQHQEPQQEQQQQQPEHQLEKDEHVRDFKAG